MSNITRLSYASTTASSVSTIRQDLVDILAEARLHNFNHKINGVMFYGNDYFFQCIEGNKTQIDALYQKIADDPRHQRIVQLSYENDVAPLFAAWAMKYVLQDEKIQQFYKNYLWEKFNPYALQDGLLKQFIRLLSEYPQSTEGEREEVNPKLRPKDLALNYHLIEGYSGQGVLTRMAGSKKSVVKKVNHTAVKALSLPFVSRAKTYSRFIYASTSTALPSTIRDHLIAITTMAENLTSQGEMSGMLIYGNNYYLHCIEASDSTVDKVWELAQTSELNIDVQLLKRVIIQPGERFFNSWTLKYFLREEPFQQFFHLQGWEKFNPYLLQGNFIDEFFHVVAGYEETISPIHAQHVAMRRAENAGSPAGFQFSPFMGFMLVLAGILVLYAIYYTVLYLGIMTSSTF